MRRLAAGLLALTLLAAAAFWAWQRWQRSPGEGELTMMREGCCLYGQKEGVRLEWSAAGATLTRVTDLLEQGVSPIRFNRMSRGFDPPRPFPLDRARAYARRFRAASEATDPRLRPVTHDMMDVRLKTGGTDLRRSLDCRPHYGRALEDGGLRFFSAVHRLRLWRAPCEVADPLLSELFDAL